MLLPSRTPRPQRATRSAFTLLEILVVVAIIVMLAGVGSYYIMQRYEDSKQSTAKLGIHRIDEQIGAYKLANGGQLPTTLQELTVKGENGTGPYLKEDELHDPWGQAYQYSAEGTHNGGLKPDVFTQVPGGKQLGNWDTNR